MHRPWLDVPFAAGEDTLHSVASFGVGFGFTTGVVVVLAQRDPPRRGPVLDGLAVSVAVGASLLVVDVVGIAGLVQRVMFAVGYAWYCTEAVRAVRAPPRDDVRPSPAATVRRP